MVLAETRKAAESVINAFKSVQANLLVQEFIKKPMAVICAVFVIDGKVVAAIERTAAPGILGRIFTRGILQRLWQNYRG